ncbi:MAG: phosphatase [Gammaproteobacteria bacterium]|nr:protein tyrosine phosphatase family protein [Gammaproteobacteria bacterium]NNC98214.1 phosphatase [Gammaproteobacteria bacterium]
MKKILIILIAAVFISACSHKGHAEKTGDMTDLHRYLQYSDIFASSSQPSEDELKLIADAGVERVIYIALNDSHGALENEAAIVQKLGMEYVHIPVDFKNPTLQDFQEFVQVMQASPETKTLLHCQVNLRASTFSFLYRALFLDVPVSQAKQDMDSIWEPNQDWFKFIKTVSEHYDLDIYCDECDWGENEFTD